jgi:hypothetical protein
MTAASIYNSTFGAGDTPGNSRMTRSTTAAIRFSDTMLDEPMASGD